MNSKLYRVEQSEHERPRQPLTGATVFDAANCRMMSIVENMKANGWWRKDAELYKKLANAIILTNGERIVTLAVVECDAAMIAGTRLELREMEWLTTLPDEDYPFEVQVIDIDQTDNDALFTDSIRDGEDVIEAESAGV